MLLVSTILTELHSFIQHAYPETLKESLDFFLYKVLLEVEVQKMSPIWYLKMLTENLLCLVIFFVVTQLSKGFSAKMFYIFGINVGYHSFDFISFVWNYKSTYQLYWAMLAFITVLQLLIIFIGAHKGKYIIMKD
jgi:hypothetical protein